MLFRVAAGRLNKQIAEELGVSEIMVKVHRSHGMRKLSANSVAELVRMSDLLRSDSLRTEMLPHPSHLAGYPLSRFLKSRFDFDERIIAGQSNEVTVGGVGLGATCIFLVLQEAVKGKFDSQSFQSICGSGC